MQPKSSRWVIAGLLVFYLVYVLINCVWLYADTAPPPWDASMHSFLSIQFSEFLQTHHTPSALVKDFKSISADPRYPFFSYLTVFPFYKLVHSKSSDVSIAAMDIVFLLVLMVSLYALGVLLFDPGVGFVAVYLTLFSPLIIVLSRYFLQDLPLTAMVTLSLYLFIKSDIFKHFRTSLLFGISVGLGLLTKSNFVIFLIPIALYAAVRIIWGFLRREEFCLRQAIYGMITLLVAIAIALPWYYVNYTRMNEWYNVPPNKLTEVTSIWPRWRYPIYLVSLRETFILRLSYLFPVAAILLLRSNRRYKFFLVFWLVFSLVLIENFKFKDARYIAPLYPILALVISEGISLVKNRILVSIALWVIIILGAVKFLVMTVPPENGDFRTKYPWMMRWYGTQINPGDWKIDAVVSVLKSDIAKTIQKQRPAVLVNYIHYIFNPPCIQYYCALYGVDCQVFSLPYAADKKVLVADPAVRYILCKDALSVTWGVKRLLNDSVKQGDLLIKGLIADHFYPLYKTRLPDGSNIILYKRKS